MATITKQDADHLRATLEDAALRCSERCLYQSAKWYITYIRNFHKNSSHSTSI
jgi:anaphase-promoting complex subunit 8